MNSQIWELCTQIVRGTVSSTYVVAMAMICVLQYVLHMHRLTQEREKSEYQKRQKRELASALRCAEAEQSISRLENQILREYLSAPDAQRGLACLLRHFVPHPETGFAALLELHDDETVIHRSRGLSQASCRGLFIDPELREQVEKERAIVFEGSQLLGSRLWSSLAPDDRGKVREIALIASAEGDSTETVLLTTTLCPAASSREDQLELAQRLMASVPAGLRINQNLQTHQVELRSTKEILELREVLDRQFETPLKRIEAFLEKLIELTEADRGVLFLTPSHKTATPKALVRCGIRLQAGVSERWSAHEETLTQVQFSGGEPLVMDERGLHGLGVDTLISSAAVVPLIQDKRLTGVLCLTRRSRSGLTDSQVSLIRSAADFLNTTMHRALNLALVQREARQDGLTELANRRAFDVQIRREVQRARTTMGECSLAIFDLDRFKSVNDTYGHQAGDEVLRVVARILCREVARIRSSDRALVARYGGEELAVLLPGFGSSGALRVADAVRIAVAETAIPLGSKALHVTLSAGTATFPHNAQDVEDLIAAADAALYQAKETGRNRVVSAEDCHYGISI